MLNYLAARARIRPAALVLIVLAAALNAVPASAEVGKTADPDLSTTIDFSGTGTLVTKVRTADLRQAASTAGAPRILIIGTGVDRALFPSELQSSITAATGQSDLADTHGYGTLAASTILQLLPAATITSYRVVAHDASWHLLRMETLANALRYASDKRSSFDAVLLAYPPQAALDPVSHVIGHVDHGKFGKGMNLVVEAMLSTRQTGSGPVAGIPTSRSLRDAMFARANLKQRDAVEKYATQAIGWRNAVRLVQQLDELGVPIIAPSGDYTRKSGGTIVPLPTQTVFGLSALPSVITVGASYLDGDTQRVSPMSGRGPTLGLTQKPDLLAPSDILALLPGQARLPWPDDSGRALSVVNWARPNVPPTACPSITGVYRCVLQGSSMVSASVVTANLAGLVASGLPNTASARQPYDDQIARGIAWAEASRTQSKAFGSTRASFPWEEGAGVFTGLKSFDAAKTPVAVEQATFGEIAPGAGDKRTVTFWGGAAKPASATAAVGGFVGPDATGQAVAIPIASDRITAAASDHTVVLTALAERAQGGFYGGRLNVTGPGGARSSLPMSYTQDVSLDFHVDYAYNEFQTGGAEGERAEDTSVVLFPGLPTNVGLIGEAFKNLTGVAYKNTGGDLLNSIMVRSGTTKSTFADAGLPASEHGRGRIDAVPPGFYRIHVLTDHALEGMQARGRAESLGIQLASSGPDAAVVPGSNILVPSQPVCGSGTSGPISGCVSRDHDSEVDPNTGLCVARNGSTQVAFNYYCGEISYAIPTATISRAVHMIEHDADATKSEWSTCGVNVPLDGTSLDIGKIVNQAKSCGGPTAPTSWSFKPKAPDCLAPAERSQYPNGHPNDVVATYSGVNTSGVRNLPVGVMTYKFRLPELNTLTTAGLSLAYSVENALVAVRFQTGEDSGADASHGLLVVDDPKLNVSPSMPGASRKGSSYNEWATMSSNATVATVSLVIIPTAWTRADLDPTKPIASVQLCDVALKVLTFAKNSWGRATTEGGVPTQFTTMVDRGLLEQVDPAKRRVRPVWDGNAFTDASTEREDLTFAVQVPKNTTKSTSAPHHVRSPKGGPAYFKGARAYSGGARGSHLLGSGYSTYDPAYGVSDLACTVGRDEPPSANVDLSHPTGDKLCRLWREAKANGEILGEVAPDAKVNGRFAGILTLDHATLTKGLGDVAYEIADADDAGAFDAAKRWVTSNGTYVRRVPLSPFHDELSPLSLNMLTGLLSVVKNSTGSYDLRVVGQSGSGTTHVITTTLR